MVSSSTLPPSLRLRHLWPIEDQKEYVKQQRQKQPDKFVSFGDWLPVVSPTWKWHWSYSVHIRQQLHRITTGEIDRLMIFVHPRIGKSEQVTVRYPVWRLERDSEVRTIIGAYNQILANKFSRKARRIAETRIELAPDRQAVEDWETKSGGGLRAVGVGSGVTGQGGHLIVIDDPIKNREEANSQTYREKVWEWYTDDLYTRLEPGGAIILIMTRWHEDDLAGRLLADSEGDRWEVVRIPALAETQQERDDYHGRIGLPVGLPDPLGRQPGAATCPDRYDENALARIKAVLGNSFYALYQQRPTAPEGDMFKRHWFEIVEATPANCKRVRYWDKAGTQNGGAFTCGVLMAKSPAGTFYIEDIVRGQWSTGQRESVIRQTAEIDGADVTIWHEQEPGSGGKESAEATNRQLAGFKVYADRVTGDKVTRAEPLAAQCEAGNVKIKRAAWNRGYLDRLTAFPGATHKDDTDASSGAFNKLAIPQREFTVNRYGGQPSTQRRRRGRSNYAG